MFLWLNCLVLCNFSSTLKKKSFSAVCFYNTLSCFKNFIPRLCRLEIPPWKFHKGNKSEKEFPFLLACFLTNSRQITQETQSCIIFVTIRHFPSDFPSDLTTMLCLRKQYFMCYVHNLCNNFSLKYADLIL